MGLFCALGLPFAFLVFKLFRMVQNMGRAAMPLQPVPNPQPGPIGGHQQEGSHEEVVQGLLNLAKGV